MPGRHSGVGEHKAPCCLGRIRTLCWRDESDPFPILQLRGLVDLNGSARRAAQRPVVAEEDAARPAPRWPLLEQAIRVLSKKQRSMGDSMGGWSWQWCLSLGVAGACMFIALKVLDFLWWRPKRLEKHFAKQGIHGPPYRFFVGCVNEMVSLMLEASSKPMIPQSSHNILPRVLSFYHHWNKIYGSPFLLWFGPMPRLAIADPDLIREIMLSRSDAFERYESHPLVRQLEGEGLVSLRGEKWAHHRKVLTPTFHMENLKLLIPFIGKTVLGMVEKLPTSGKEVEIDVSEWFQTVTEDAITQTAFGRSFEDGKAVFQLQTQQMLFAAEAFRNVFIPGYRFLPTKKNTSSWKLEKEIKRSLIELIGRRRQRPVDEEKRGDDSAKDLLGLMIDASVSKQSPVRPAPAEERQPAAPPQESTMTIRDIVEECKTFFFAGKQTTSNLLTWTTVLLAMHPEWQERARGEVLRVCGPCDVPSRHHLPKLKTLGMILHETLRLYPPAVATIRRAKADVVLGGYHIPAGTELLIPIMGLHHDEQLWGADVAQFNPARFADGAARAARHPTAFIPFGLGPRMCIGQNLAVLEAKLTVAVLLQRFALRLSPAYVHAPTVLMLLYPQFGAPILFRSLNSS
ncbi:Cytochrome P450 [Canna indica]|uniref:Cytochrome P450 n=1 Tax=Canna indica TaxID=4628 RepID=A0AAQ3QGW5_9LILI|nr:Cytochrome P450 [Canna indica]